ncbi:MAG: TIGR03984 family CRISPR-associated protein [Candidatus Kuenenia sp.]|nr:TIGR03984 family CRISPR-associated protein [Candidatus Kuenenia hertensis]
MREANGLQLREIKSKSIPFPVKNKDIEDFEKCISARISVKSYIVAYLDYKVLIGTFENGVFHFYKDEKFDPKHIQKLRVFNQTQELYLWRSSDGMRGRYRTDEEGKETFVVDAEQVLFGTKAEPPDSGFTKITETRGTELTLPFSNLSVDDKRNRVFIKTRNYIDYNEVNQATYVDCRFMGFWNNGKELT